MYFVFIYFFFFFHVYEADVKRWGRDIQLSVGYYNNLTHHIDIWICVEFIRKYHRRKYCSFFSALTVPKFKILKYWYFIITIINKTSFRNFSELYVRVQIYLICIIFFFNLTFLISAPTSTTGSFKLILNKGQNIALPFYVKFVL